jgi:RecB family exonuclease
VLSGVYRPPDLEPLDDPRPTDSALRRLLPVLAAHGRQGRLDAVELPAPAGVDGSPPPRERHALEVRVSEPGAERAAELIRRRPAPPESDPLEGEPASPPLLEGLPHPVPAGHLSYSALGEYERCGYRFYIERVLGAREASQTVQPSLAFGNAVHALLEWSARNSWRAPGAERVAAALSCEGLPAEAADAARATAMVERWLGSELCRSLAEGGARLHPEAAFLLPVAGTVVRGKIDLLAEPAGGGLLVVDYKTDALNGEGPGERIARYEAQRALYALAATESAAPAGDGRTVRTAYAFLDADEPPLERSYDERALAGARAELERLAEGIRSGSFTVTDRPRRELCGDCPARERLCSHPPERTLGAAE